MSKECGEKVSKFEVKRPGKALRSLLAISALAFSITGCFEGMSPEEVRKESTGYTYQILVGGYNPDIIYLYTNVEPRITLSGDNALLEAKNVYCPQKQLSTHVPARRAARGCGQTYTETLSLVVGNGFHLSYRTSGR